MNKKLGSSTKTLLLCAALILGLTACSVKQNETITSNAPESTIELPPITSANAAESTQGVTTSEQPVESSVPVTETEEAVLEEPVYTIHTKFCDLKFPEKWQTHVNTLIDETEPYTVRFTYADGTPLFDIVFGECAGTLLGRGSRDMENRPVYYVGYELDENNAGYYDQLGIQDAADVILQNLKQDYGLAEEAPAEDTPEGVYRIDTPFAALYYPQKWEDAVTVTINGKSVTFSYGEIALFDICFEERDGAFLGTYDGTPVYAVSCDVSPEHVSADEYRDICAMQDDINVILEYLRKDEKFR